MTLGALAVRPHERVTATSILVQETRTVSGTLQREQIESTTRGPDGTTG